MPELLVRHAASSAAVVRTSVQATLESAEVTADDTYEVIVVVSELLTNAIRHAPALPSGHIAVRWSVQTAGCLIKVTDGGCTPPLTAAEAGNAAVHGRGLAIVDTIADDWGSDSQDESTTVWAFYRFNRSATRSELASA